VSALIQWYNNNDETNSRQLSPTSTAHAHAMHQHQLLQQHSQLQKQQQQPCTFTASTSSSNSSHAITRRGTFNNNNNNNNASSSSASSSFKQLPLLPPSNLFTNDDSYLKAVLSSSNFLFLRNFATLGGTDLLINHLQKLTTQRSKNTASPATAIEEVSKMQSIVMAIKTVLNDETCMNMFLANKMAVKTMVMALNFTREKESEMQTRLKEISSNVGLSSMGSNFAANIFAAVDSYESNQGKDENTSGKQPVHPSASAPAAAAQPKRGFLASIFSKGSTTSDASVSNKPNEMFNQSSNNLNSSNGYNNNSNTSSSSPSSEKQQQDQIAGKIAHLRASILFVLAVICFFSDDGTGSKLVLEAFDHYAYEIGEKTRFQSWIDTLTNPRFFDA